MICIIMKTAGIRADNNSIINKEYIGSTISMILTFVSYNFSIYIISKLFTKMRYIYIL